MHAGTTCQGLPHTPYLPLLSSASICSTMTPHCVAMVPEIVWIPINIGPSPCWIVDVLCFRMSLEGTRSMPRPLIHQLVNAFSELFLVMSTLAVQSTHRTRRTRGFSTRTWSCCTCGRYIIWILARLLLLNFRLSLDAVGRTQNRRVTSLRPCIDDNSHLDPLLVRGDVGAGVLLTERGALGATGWSQWAAKAAHYGAHFVRCDEFNNR